MTPEEVMRQLLNDMQQANADQRKTTFAQPAMWEMLEQLFRADDSVWRSADGKLWRLDPAGKGSAPLISPTHAERVIEYLRERYLPFGEEVTEAMVTYFEQAIPIIQALKHRVETATKVEWTDAKWHDWMWRKQNPDHAEER